MWHIISSSVFAARSLPALFIASNNERIITSDAFHHLFVFFLDQVTGNIRNLRNNSSCRLFRNAALESIDASIM